MQKNKTEGGEGDILDTQNDYARAFCEHLGWEIAGVARDNISGRVAPIDRKNLGKSRASAFEVNSDAEALFTITGCV